MTRFHPSLRGDKGRNSGSSSHHIHSHKQRETSASIPPTPLLAFVLLPPVLRSPGRSVEGAGLPTVGWVLVQQLAIRTVPSRHAHRPVWSGQFLNWASPHKWLHAASESVRMGACISPTRLVYFGDCFYRWSPGNVPVIPAVVHSWFVGWLTGWLQGELILNS